MHTIPFFPSNVFQWSLLLLLFSSYLASVVAHPRHEFDSSREGLNNPRNIEETRGKQYLTDSSASLGEDGVIGVHYANLYERQNKEQDCLTDCSKVTGLKPGERNLEDVPNWTVLNTPDDINNFVDDLTDDFDSLSLERRSDFDIIPRQARKKNPGKPKVVNFCVRDGRLTPGPASNPAGPAKSVPSPSPVSPVNGGTPVPSPGTSKQKGEKIKIIGKTGDYPGPAALVKNLGQNAVRTYGLVDPTDCDNFDFGRIDTPDIAMLAEASKAVKGLTKSVFELQVEHVLEAQLISQFLDGLANQKKTLSNPDTRKKNSPATAPINIEFCDYFEIFWNPPVDATPLQLSDQIPARKTNVESKKFALQWLMLEFPDNKYKTEEFVLLGETANNMKSKLWAEADSQLVSDTVMKDAIESQDESEFKSSLIKYKNALALLKYHQYKFISKVFKDQVGRIADRFNSLEKTLSGLKGVKYDAGRAELESYASFGLSKKWKEFMIERTDNSIKKLNTFLDTWEKQFREKEQQLKKVLSKTPKKEKEKIDDLSNRIKSIKALLKAAKDGGVWENPLVQNAKVKTVDDDKVEFQTTYTLADVKNARA